MLEESFIEERKKDLLKQKERVEKELQEVASKSDGSYKPKFPQFGDKDEDNELEVSEFEENIDMEERLKKMLQDTDEALSRIKEGKYGYCENCHKEIDPARLKAYPAATTCLDCE